MEATEPEPVDLGCTVGTSFRADHKTDIQRRLDEQKELNQATGPEPVDLGCTVPTSFRSDHKADLQQRSDE